MSSEDLFKNFKAGTKADWLSLVKKDLRGKEYESLVFRNPDGIDIQPVYTAEDITAAGQPFRKAQSWKIVQEVGVYDAAKANKHALDHLNRGANALLFYLLPGADLDLLLRNILLEHIDVHFVTEGNTLEICNQLNAIIEKKNLLPAQVNGSINIDCLENLARTGNWFRSEDADFREIASITEKAPPGLKTICVNANLFANAGATLGQQLGIALAMVYEYIYRLDLKSAGKFWVNFAVGSDYFGEISKLRAFRRLWKLLLTELGLPDTPAYIYAETALRNKSLLDIYNNMIRSSAEAMAAGIAGCDEFCAKSFDAILKETSPFGERIAKNQQNILQHESHLDKVRDIAGGSYFLEALTEKTAKAGWKYFKDIEAQGGYIKALQEGWLQREVEQSAHREQEAFDSQQKVLIGANKYRKKDENLSRIIKQGVFYRKSERDTCVQPVQVKRLSESLEQAPVTNPEKQNDQT